MSLWCILTYLIAVLLLGALIIAITAISVLVTILVEVFQAIYGRW